MPGGDRGLQYRGLFPQYATSNHSAFIVKVEHHEAPAQGGEQLPGLQMAMGANVGIWLHGNGQPLDGVGQLVVQIVIHALARGVGGLGGETGKACDVQFFHVQFHHKAKAGASAE